MGTSEHTSAQIALREATQALSVRRNGTGDTGPSDTDLRALAGDLAVTLEAVASLLRSLGVSVESEATQGLPAVAEHVDRGALIARHACGDQEADAPAEAHLDAGRHGTADD